MTVEAKGESSMVTIARASTPSFSASLKIIGSDNLVGSRVLGREDISIIPGINVRAIKNPFKEKFPVTTEDVPKAVEEAQRLVTEPIKAPRTQTIERTNLPAESLLMLVFARNFLPVFSDMALNFNPAITPKSVVEKTVLKTEGRLIFSQAQPQTKSSEKTTQLKIKLVEAVEVSKNRVRVLWGAYQKIKTEGLSLKWLRKFLGISYWQHLSPIAKNGYDGTLDPTVREAEAYGDKIKDDQEAENTFERVVSNHIPVKKGEGNRLATAEEVREVREGIEKENLRSKTPVEIVVKRAVIREKETVAITGQAVNAVVEEKEEVAGEPTLKSLGLEQVFPKAA